LVGWFMSERDLLLFMLRGAKDERNHQWEFQASEKWINDDKPNGGTNLGGVTFHVTFTKKTTYSSLG